MQIGASYYAMQNSAKRKKQRRGRGSAYCTQQGKGNKPRNMHRNKKVPCMLICWHHVPELLWMQQPHLHSQARCK
jgi:hypothetical protein